MNADRLFASLRCHQRAADNRKTGELFTDARLRGLLGTCTLLATATRGARTRARFSLCSKALQMLSAVKGTLVPRNAAGFA